MSGDPAFPADWGIANARLLADGIGGRIWETAGRDGGALIVKEVSALAAAEAPQALAFLRWRDGAGAVRLLDARGRLQLLEHAGMSTLLDVLEHDGDDAAATAVAAEAVQKLHAPSPRPVPAVLQALPERFSALFRQAQRGPPLIAEGARLAESLLARQRDHRPLHGDLHHGNLLLGHRGWLAIDPHGLFGDAGYDIANLFYNPVERPDLRASPARAAAMAEQLAKTLGRDAGELLGWGCAHACLSASWHLEDGNAAEARDSLAVAEAVRRALAARA